MKTKDELLHAFSDELSGLILAAFSVQERTLAKEDADYAIRGRFMTQQLRRARDLLGRIHDFMAGSSPAKPQANGAPAQTQTRKPT